MNLSLLTTEIVTVCLAVFIVAIDLVIPDKESRRGIGYMTFLGLLGIFGHTFTQYGINDSVYNGMYRIDNFAVFCKQIFLASAILTVLFSLNFVDRLPRYQGEYYSFLIFATLGMMVMASANDLLTMFVGMELMAITFYILVGYLVGNARSSEAGLKYMILGAASTAVLLYGISLIYGYTGSLVLTEIMTKMSANLAVMVGMIFIVVGFSFKIAAVPFHMWSPDIYEGAPVPVTALLAMASKAAGFAVLMRVLLIAFPALQKDWVVLLVLLSAGSMIIGNLLAMPQRNVKRLLAYSSIAQAGYLLTGVIAANQAGVKGVLFYAMLYVFANVGAFCVVVVIHNSTGSDDMEAYEGLAQRSPFLAAVMTVSLLSMAGIPPLAGFTGKFYLFSAVVEQGFLWLALLGFVMSMISVYYYLLVAKAMYLEDNANPQPLLVSQPLGLAAIVSLVLTIFFGIYPGPLANLATTAAKSLF